MRFDEKVDWEVELGVFIGSHCSYVDEQDAHEYISGYCVMNDISESAFQLEGAGQWVKGKSADTFGPTGTPFGCSDSGNHSMVWQANAALMEPQAE